MASIDFRKEVKREHILRDVRSPTRRFKDSLLDYKYPFLWVGAAAIGAFLFSPIAEAFMIAGYAIANSAIRKQRLAGMPCTYPKSANKLDPKKLDHKGHWQKGEGIFYCGTDRHTGKELWIDGEQMKRHSFFLGTTGSGKTEFLLSIMLNSLIQGSGYVFIDGKGDIKMYHSAYSQARALGRESDILLLNFLTGEKDIIGAQDSKISNTFNYFGAGNSDASTQTTNSIIDAEDDIWGKKATAFVEALMRPLVFKRNEYGVNLDAEEVRSYFSLAKLERLYLLERFTYPGLVFPLKGMSLYLSDATLPGWDVRNACCYSEFLCELNKVENAKQLEYVQRNEPDLWFIIKDDFQYTKEEMAKGELDMLTFKKSLLERNPLTTKGTHSTETAQQHAYITMQLFQVFGSLADTYGYIMRTSAPDIDLRDVILHRRILIALLPALAKSPAELKNLGRIVLSVIKTAMVTGLGYKAEGDVSKIIENRPTDAESPIPVVADECGVYLVNGSFVLPAQGRSLGVSMVFAAQDISALVQNLEKESDSILANTVNKFCGKLDDKESAEYFENLAGEGKFAVVGGFEKSDSYGHRFTEGENVNLEDIKRVSFNDLRSHKAGHWHYFFENNIFYIQSFYANTKTVKELRVNHFLEISNIGSEEKFAIKRVINKIDSLFTQEIDKTESFSDYINLFLDNKKQEKTSQLVSLILLNKMYNQEYKKDIIEMLSQEKEDETDDIIMYTPFSFPVDLDNENLNNLLDEDIPLNKMDKEKFSLKFGDSDENELSQGKESFTQGLLVNVLGAFIDGNMFNILSESISGKNLKSSETEENVEAKKDVIQRSFKGERARRRSIAEKMTFIINPKSSREERAELLNIKDQVDDNLNKDRSTYSIFINSNKDEFTHEKISIIFDNAIKYVEVSNSIIANI